MHATFPIDVTATAATTSGTTHAALQVTTTEDDRLLLTFAATATDTSWTPAAGTAERIDVAGASDAPTVTVGVAEREQLAEGLSTAKAPTSATSAVGADPEVSSFLRCATRTVPGSVIISAS